MPTATETTSIEAQLRALVRLQYFDSRIHQLTKLQGDLPEEIRDLEDEKAGLETRIENSRREAREGEVQRRKLALDVTESEGLIRRYEEQQLQVRNNREYDALTKEIEAQRARIQAAQEETEALTLRDEQNTGGVEEAQGRLSELEELLATKRAELETVVQDTRAEQEALEARREEATAAIDPRYLRAYERLRAKMRDGRAVVPIDARGAAAGYAVPPQRQMEVRQRDRIIASEHDGRILVDEQLYREVVEEQEKE
jgi:predicted  nucleic acid-binding Zn-ribbon protein